MVPLILEGRLVQEAYEAVMAAGKLCSPHISKLTLRALHGNNTGEIYTNPVAPYPSDTWLPIQRAAHLYNQYRTYMPSRLTAEQDSRAYSESLYRSRTHLLVMKDIDRAASIFGSLQHPGVHCHPGRSLAFLLDLFLFRLKRSQLLQARKR
jgi:hypothetical protein